MDCCQVDKFSGIDDSLNLLPMSTLIMFRDSSSACTATFMLQCLFPVTKFCREATNSIKFTKSD